MEVAPHAGAWIEIMPRMVTSSVEMSLPMRERGLKFMIAESQKMIWVAPHAGAWIEILW